MKYPKLIITGIFTALAVNMLTAVLAFGQSSNQSSVNVTRSGGSLTFLLVPQAFDFGTISTPVVRTPVYTNPMIDGWNTNLLAVQDTRDSGGFTVTLSANGNFTDGGSETIPVSNASPNDNLRIVTSPPQGKGGTTVNGVVYEPDFVGSETVSAPLNVEITNPRIFGTESTFVNVPNNILDTSIPVLVLDGTLAASNGKIGQLGTGVASMLYIPAFQASGQYKTTLTWTLADSTN